ncbi:MAG: peptide deformylase [Planctomycetota bacterium]
MFSQSSSSSDLPPSDPILGPEQLRLRLYPDPILHRRCQPLGQPDDNARACIRRMFELMYEHQGIGLAAPQVGWNARVFIMNVTESDDEVGIERVFIDPEIEIPSESRGVLEEEEEGCLSLPGIRLHVDRQPAVTVQATGVDGERFDLQSTGLLARCIQHENDHLDGILIPSRVSTLQRIAVKGALRDLEEQWAAGESRS